jgi:hypothetical protein
MALDAEMVVGFYGQGAVTVVALEDALGENNAGRYAVGLHLPDGNGLVLLNVLVAAYTVLGKAGEMEENGETENCGDDPVHSYSFSDVKVANSNFRGAIACIQKLHFAISLPG